MMDLVAAGLDELHERIAGRFARSESRTRVREYVSGLVTGKHSGLSRCVMSYCVA